MTSSQKAASANAGTLDFLASPGDMARRIREYDWTKTALGPPASWSMPLKTLVGLMLSSVQPMFMAWGVDQTWLYNDAFVPILGDKHPIARQHLVVRLRAGAADNLIPPDWQHLIAAGRRRSGSPC